jgi:hypothetical protein
MNKAMLLVALIRPFCCYQDALRFKSNIVVAFASVWLAFYVFHYVLKIHLVDVLVQ